MPVLPCLCNIVSFSARGNCKYDQIDGNMRAVCNKQMLRFFFHCTDTIFEVFVSVAVVVVLNCMVSDPPESQTEREWVANSSYSSLNCAHSFLSLNYGEWNLESLNGVICKSWLKMIGYRLYIGYIRINLTEDLHIEINMDTKNINFSMDK